MGGGGDGCADDGGDIGRLNAAWGTRFASFDDLAAHRPDPILRRGLIYEGFRAFSREIVRKHVEVTLRVIREEDPGRLVFSQCLMLSGLCEAIHPKGGSIGGFGGLATHRNQSVEPGQ